MLYALLRRKGWIVNHKRAERLYREEWLSLRLKRRKKRMSHLRVARTMPVGLNERWYMDFVCVPYIWIFAVVGLLTGPSLP